MIVGTVVGVALRCPVNNAPNFVLGRVVPDESRTWDERKNLQGALQVDRPP